MKTLVEGRHFVCLPEAIWHWLAMIYGVQQFLHTTSTNFKGSDVATPVSDGFLPLKFGDLNLSRPDTVFSSGASSSGRDVHSSLSSGLGMTTTNFIEKRANLTATGQNSFQNKTPAKAGLTDLVNSMHRGLPRYFLTANIPNTTQEETISDGTIQDFLI
ncbi:unnamed protein product [Protopolystoma xenopodis]|uniref:Uncharacterized protein n=1 Tax=Protopolystoma xenopodis TaxID=117903 RepID=A0A448WVS4_9PLAT|nr:unnamed protein product [Protopolystoma xenopodis]